MAEKSRKIAVLSVITQAEIGGAQQFVAQLARNLDPDYFSCVVAAGARGPQDLAALLPNHIRYVSLSNLIRSLSPLRDIRGIQELRALIRSVAPDILLLNSSKAGFLGAAAARSLRTEFPAMRVVYRIGGWTFNDPWPRTHRALYRMLERISAGWKDVIVVNNQSDFNQARELGIRPRSYIQMIHNGIDPYLPFLSQEDARAIITKTIPPEHTPRHIVGTIANFYPTKDLATLIAAAELLPRDTHVCIIGDGELRADLERDIMERGLGDRVHLLGRRKNAYELLPAFDVFTLCSVKEGFPWSILEAIAAKVPVVATNVGAAAEIIEDGISGTLVPPETPEALAHALRQLLESGHLRQELAIQAHQRLLSRFSLRMMMERYEHLFRELTGRIAE